MTSVARIQRRLLDKQARRERPKIRPALLKLRQRAIESGETEFMVVAGWSFALDISMIDDECRGRSAVSVAEEKKLMAALKIARPATSCDGRCGKTHTHCHFSARLTPTTRSTGTEDWHNLGLALGVLGVPEEVIRQGDAQVADDRVICSRAIHYFWEEKPW